MHSPVCTAISATHNVLGSRIVCVDNGYTLAVHLPPAISDPFSDKLLANINFDKRKTIMRGYRIRCGKAHFLTFEYRKNYQANFWV